MLEHIQLAIVREIERQGSLTAAADVLCITQSALSHAIRKLESQLDVEIWKRDGRRLQLTPAGTYLLNLANRLIPQVEHAEEIMQQYARGQRGTLRIGMECHPCYQWLLKVVGPYLIDWPKVDVDVKQKFQFGGIGALTNYEIDVLVTPDPITKQDLLFEPVFDYEQVLVVAKHHKLAEYEYILPKQLNEETLITYPVEIERLDIYNQFLSPARCAPKKHKTIETTDIMLKMVETGRGVAALPGWLVSEYAKTMAITSLRLGKQGIQKQIFLGIREDDIQINYLKSFVDLAKRTN